MIILSGIGVTKLLSRHWRTASCRRFSLISLYFLACSSVRIARILVRVCSCSIRNLPVVGLQQFPIFGEQLIEIGPGSFDDTLKLLPLLGSEFELVVIDLVYFPRGSSGVSICLPSRFVDIVDYCSSQPANHEYRQDEQLCSRRHLKSRRKVQQVKFSGGRFRWIDKQACTRRLRDLVPQPP